MKEISIDHQEIENLLELSLCELRCYDQELFISKNKVDTLSEWSIAHRLAVYLEANLYKRFPEYRRLLSVDCEYNRDGFNVKRLPRNSFQLEDRIRPDIVIHRRREESNGNVLVIEIKKNASDKDKNEDLKKLLGFKKDYGYKHAIFINFVGESSHQIDYVAGD